MGFGGIAMRVELDRRALFALASDTRVEILKALQPMRRTVTQLAEALDIDKAAVHRHLQKLVEGGLVKRHEDHGFVYYGLSWKARDLLNPNDNTKIVILLTTAILLLGLAVILSLALSSAYSGGVQTLGGDAFDETQTGDTPPDTNLGNQDYTLAWLLPATILPSASIILLVVAARRMWRPKQPVP